jgi:GT2 family glycosyltransferase
LSANRDQPDRKPQEVSIIIATANRHDSLRRALESLAALPDADRRSLEVIVSDDGSMDDTPSVINAASTASPLDIRAIRSETQFGAAAARNRALAVARGRFIVFADDDCRFSAGWLDITGGPDIPPTTAPLIDQCIGFLFTSFIGTGGLRHGERLKVAPYYPRGCNMALKRDVFDRVGMLDESLAPGEEVELGHRAEAAGCRIEYIADAIVIHERQLNVPRLLRKIYRIGKFRAELIPRLHDARQFGHMLPFLAICALVVAIAAASIWPPLRLPLLAIVALYGVALLTGGALAAANIGDWRAALVVPPLLCAHHAAHAIGFGTGVLKLLFRRTSGRAGA